MTTATYRESLLSFYATINFHQWHAHRIVTCLYRSENFLTNSPSVFWLLPCRKVEPQNGEREVVSTCVGSFSISPLHDNKEVFQRVKEVDRREFQTCPHLQGSDNGCQHDVPKAGVNSYHSTRIENRKEWFIGLIRQSWLAKFPLNRQGTYWGSWYVDIVFYEDQEKFGVYRRWPRSSILSKW